MTAQCQVNESKLQGTFSCFVNKRATGKLIDKFVWFLRTSVLYDPLTLLNNTCLCHRSYPEERTHWSYAGAEPGFGVHMVKWRTSKRHGNETFLGAKQAFESHRGWFAINGQKLVGDCAGTSICERPFFAVRMQLLQVLSKLVKIGGH